MANFKDTTINGFLEIKGNKVDGDKKIALQLPKNTHIYIGNEEFSPGIKNVDWNNDLKEETKPPIWQGSGDNAIVQNSNNNGAYGEFSHAEGYGCYAYGIASHAEGAEYDSTNTGAIGRASHAEGAGTGALADGSHSEGILTEAGRDYDLNDDSFVDDLIEDAVELGLIKPSDVNNLSQEKIQMLVTKLIGYGAHAEGSHTQALGSSSHAEGNETIAHVNASHAEGDTTVAWGEASHAEGHKTTAEGNQSHAEGKETYAKGNAAHAEGKGCQANEYGSHAEGSDTVADGLFAHSEGANTNAKGDSSHAEGKESKANGYTAHAEGLNTRANGNSSHAEGKESQANGYTAHAEGLNTRANGLASHSEGTETIAAGENQHVQGKFNIVDTKNKYVHIVGNGEKNDVVDEYGNVIEQNRSNAHTLDWNGKAWYQASMTSNGADYSEFFEWQDGNADNEDRVGLLVALDGEKIRLANSGDEILGIISGTAAVLGDNYECEWNGKYLTDDFGRVIYDLVEEFIDEEHIEFKEVEKEIIDEETNETRIEIELEEVKTVEKQSLGFWKHPRINPDYDPEQAYINRSDRPEWDVVGLLGKLYVRDDGTCIPNYYATIGENGIATSSLEKTNMRILSRINSNVIRVLLK